MNQPLVSIGLPAFKGAHFAEALRSIKNQTYRNIEVIVQDDASPDNLRAIFDVEVGGDRRFVYARNEKNSAPYFVHNWQLTVDKAKGEWFVLAGDDDLYESNFVSEMLAQTEKYPDVDLFFAWQDCFNSKGVVGVPYKVPEYQSQIEWLYSAIKLGRYYQAQCGFVRLSALKRMGGFVDLLAAWPSDLVTWSELSRNGVVTSQQVLMHWRFDGNNISSKKSESWSLLKIRAACGIHASWLESISKVVATSDDERFEKAAVIKLMTENYLPWLVYSEFPRLSMMAQIRVIMHLSQEKWLSRKKAFRMILGIVKRSIFTF